MIASQHNCTFYFSVRDNRFFTECAQIQILFQSSFYLKVFNSEIRDELYKNQYIIFEESKLLYFSLIVKSKYKSGGCLLIIKELNKLFSLF